MPPERLTCACRCPPSAAAAAAACDTASHPAAPWCRKHALAGGTAGLAATLILHPLDVVKTRLQGACCVLGTAAGHHTVVAICHSHQLRCLSWSLHELTSALCLRVHACSARWRGAAAGVPRHSGRAAADCAAGGLAGALLGCVGSRAGGKAGGRQEQSMDWNQQHVGTDAMLAASTWRDPSGSDSGMPARRPLPVCRPDAGFGGQRAGLGHLLLCLQPSQGGQRGALHMLQAQRLIALAGCGQSIVVPAQPALPAGNSWGAPALPSTLLLLLQTTPKQERYQRASGQSKLSPGWHLVSAAEAGAVVS